MNAIILITTIILLIILILCLVLQLSKFFFDQLQKKSLGNTDDNRYPYQYLKLVKSTKLLITICIIGIFILGLLNLAFN